MKISLRNNLLLHMTLSVVMAAGVCAQDQDVLKRLKVESVQLQTIPLSIDRENDALVVIRSTLTNLRFSSNLGGIKGPPRKKAGEYTLKVTLEKQRLTVSAPGYMDVSLYVLKLGEGETIAFSIEPEEDLSFTPGKLVDFVFDSEPSGARFWLIGVGIDTVTFRTPNLAQRVHGRYIIKVSKPEYRDTVVAVVVSDKNTGVVIKLQPTFGIVRISAKGCRILIDGNSVGADSYEGHLVQGPHEVTARQDGPFRPAVENVTVVAGEMKELILEPKGRFGKLSVLVEPSGAKDAAIFINDKPRGNAPFQEVMLMGIYELVARKEGYVDVTTSATVQEEMTRNIRLTMQTYEGSREQLRSRWGNVKTWTGIGGILAGGAAAYFKISANRDYNRYVAATESQWALYYRNRVSKFDKLYGYSLYVVAGLITTALVSWVVQGVL